MDARRAPQHSRMLVAVLEMDFKIFIGYTSRGRWSKYGLSDYV